MATKKIGGKKASAKKSTTTKKATKKTTKNVSQPSGNVRNGAVEYEEMSMEENF